MRLAAIFGMTILTGVSVAVASETKRELSAHEHGVGKLNIAFESDKIAMELEAPGSDIVGFEHHAVSAEDRKKVDAAIAILAKPLDMFVLPSEAKCQVKEAKVELHGEGEDDHKEKHAEAKHDEHEHKHAEKKHDDHKDEHAEAKHDDHKHGDEASHTEFHAEYVFSCEKPSAVTQIQFPYFKIFPNAKELEVQAVSEKGSTAFEVERDKPSLNLSGMM